MHHLLLNDIKILMRSWISLLLLFLIPIFVSLILIEIMEPIFDKNSFIKPFAIGVVDFDQSIGSKMAISSLESEGYISKTVQVKILDYKEAISQLNNGSLVSVIIIPEGFSQSLYLGDNKPIKVYVNQSEITNSKLMENFLGNAADLVIAAQSGIYTVYHMMLKSNAGSEQAYQAANKSIPDFMLNAMGRKEVFNTVTLSNIPQTGAKEYYIICMSVMFIMFSGILGLRLISRDFESDVIKRILISPGGILKYIIEKIIIMAIISFTEYIAVIIPLTMHYNSFLNFINIKVLISVITIVLASTSFCILISIFSKSSSAAVTWSIMSIFIICMAGGCIYPAAVMSEWLRTLSNYVFSSWALDGMLLSVTNAPISETINIWGALLAFAAITVFISTLIVERGGYRFLQD
ncbi:MAG: ABC transporter permease [Ignavibacteriales bacterium]